MPIRVVASPTSYASVQGLPRTAGSWRVREALGTHHYSRRTEKAYVAWIRRYILFHDKRHPAEMGAVVRDGKGEKDRVTMLPAAVKRELELHLTRVRAQHQVDLVGGAGWVELPYALARKYPRAGHDWGWQWVFSATRIYTDRVTGERRRHHLHESVLQGAVRRAHSSRVSPRTRPATFRRMTPTGPPAGRLARPGHRDRNNGTNLDT